MDPRWELQLAGGVEWSGAPCGGGRERERERERDYELLEHKTPPTLHGRTYSPALLGDNSLNHEQKRDWRVKQ